MDQEPIAQRAYGEAYRVSGRADVHAFVEAAIDASGGRVVYSSGAERSPIYFGIQIDDDERLGVLVYPFRMTRVLIKNRPSNEVRGQIRYGSEESWNREHPLGFDVAGVDSTVVVGVDLEDGIFVGLDPRLYDPLPMGISFYAKVDAIEVAQREGWHVWEKVNRSGTKRSIPRSPTELETLVAFGQERFLDYVRLERRATSLRLDPPLRYSAAVDAKYERPNVVKRHALETQFDLTSEQILEIIRGRNRLSVAVRGGVAEYHLESLLLEDPSVENVERLDIDAMHDFNVTLADGRLVRLECKNASPERYKNGDYKVEIQKTRASKGDPASRMYASNAFDAVAACLYSATGAWTFRFGLTSMMDRHHEFPDRLAPLQHIDATWGASIGELG